MDKTTYVPPYMRTRQETVEKQVPKDQPQREYRGFQQRTYQDRQQSTERSYSRSYGRPTENQNGRSNERSYGRPYERSYGRPTERSTEIPTERPTERSTERPTESGRLNERSYSAITRKMPVHESRERRTLESVVTSTQNKNLDDIDKPPAKKQKFKYVQNMYSQTLTREGLQNVKMHVNDFNKFCALYKKMSKLYDTLIASETNINKLIVTLQKQCNVSFVTSNKDTVQKIYESKFLKEFIGLADQISEFKSSHNTLNSLHKECHELGTKIESPVSLFFRYTELGHVIVPPQNYGWNIYVERESYKLHSPNNDFVEVYSKYDHSRRIDKFNKLTKTIETFNSKKRPIFDEVIKSLGTINEFEKSKLEYQKSLEKKITRGGDVTFDVNEDEDDDIEYDDEYDEYYDQ
jgi:hypothetical protein